MSDLTVRQLADVVGIPLERLLSQLSEAGLEKQGPDELLSDAEKMAFLGFLRQSHGKSQGEDLSSPKRVTLQRRTVSELKLGKATPGKAAKTISVEVRKKKTYVKRSELPDVSEQRHEVEQARMALEEQQRREVELELERKARQEEEARKAEELERLRREEIERIAREQQEPIDHVATFGMQVAAAWRGRVVGSALLAEALRWAGETGVRKVELSVYPDNDAARALYARFGFVEEGRLVRHSRRSDGFVDEILMGRWLGEDA